jgi:uncharacterized protein (TIGR03790 family)
MAGVWTSFVFFILQFCRTTEKFCIAKSQMNVQQGLGPLFRWLAKFACVVASIASADLAAGQPAPPSTPEPASVPAAATARTIPPRPPTWLAVSRDQGRLTSRDIGVVINTLDPYSVAVGRHYIAARKLQPDQVLRVEIPARAVLTPEEFQLLADRITQHFGARTQALALAWKEPYAVGCNSITGALALGYDAALCSQTCERTRLSPYFNAPTNRPWTELKLRPSMLLAAPDIAAALRLIDRGVASDGSLGLRGALPVNAWYLSTSDRARNVRAGLYPPPGLVRSFGIDVHVDARDELDHPERVLLYLTGLARVEGLDNIAWVPGALADHLTSTGGVLDDSSGQMPATAWIGSGATASYGSVSEPCNHPQKFPHPQILLLHYAQGQTALEAYWKSVAWPQQGVFIGEPLAAPFARASP